MLQIISGKFYKSRECNICDGKGIIYSNYSWINPINTCIATIEPIDFMCPITPYIIFYQNKIEKGSIIVRTGDCEIVHQFKLLCIFGLKAFFDNDRNLVDFKCREVSKGSNDFYIPSRFVRRIFNTRINGNQEEIDIFCRFVEKAISLPREIYNALISCLNNYVNALQTIDYNMDLAYSMLVYSLESLSQLFDSYVPVWEDYNQNIKDELEKQFLRINPSLVDTIKDILVKDSNLKLQGRFLNFAMSNITNYYFKEDAIGLINPLRKSEIKKVLSNAYYMRSKYVHVLQPIRKQLKIPQIAEADVFYWENEPFLTLAGLARLTHHIIYNFVLQQDSILEEEYNWQSELPGVFQLYPAPQYWIWEDKDFRPEDATKRLSGFLSYFVDLIRSREREIVDLAKILDKFEKLIPISKKPYKVQMLTLYWIYNSFLAQEVRRPNFEKTIKNNKNLLEECCVENMVAYLLLDMDWIWSVDDCKEAFLFFTAKKFSKTSLSLPNLLEACIYIAIANMYIDNKNKKLYEEWLDYACCELPGLFEMHNLINEHKNRESKIDISLILKPKSFDE